MHSPKAHITAQGKVLNIIGATPAATNQFQLKKIPMATTPESNTIREVRVLISGQTTISARCALLDATTSFSTFSNPFLPL